MALGLTAVATVMTAAPASAACVESKLQGNWHNIDPNAGGLARVDVAFTCNDQRICDENGHCTGPDIFHTMHPYGRCHPTDCDWGERRATNQSDGWIEANFDFGFVNEFVWLKTYEFDGLTYLRAWTWHDFAPGDSRADFATDEWMLR
jgi:hypothetical protein